MHKSLYVAGHFGSGFGGSAIKWFTDRPFSHVSFVVEEGDLPLLEIESIQGKGVWSKEFDADKFDGQLFAVQPDQESISLIIEEALRLRGAKYDWSGIFGFLVRRKKQNDKKWFCSEFVAHCCNKGGVMLQRMHHYKQTPGIVCASVRLKPVPLPTKWKG